MAYGFYRDETAELPHKPIPLAIYLIVEEALRVAWQRLKGRTLANFDIKTANEDKITLELYKVFYDEVFDRGLVDGFDEDRFTVGTRESKFPNYDGTKPDLMPDLIVAIKGRSDVSLRTQDWLFIECKPVDADHTVGVHYGAKGIARFIRGEYAWAMTSALMVGYASPGYTIVPKLVKTLAIIGGRGKEFEVLQVPKPCGKSTATAFAERVHSTKHGRTFCYVENGKHAPLIELRHLWLTRN
ncbi:hypothetical protein [Prosthecobacter sp.]|uniref:hypothetical protein n=1 Tax=Prosthecobacter sp. TaxID=1965333 RepID=UPI00248A088D|nr:hypothetical protein [Prosthecobacter sp.]MDI1313813.1 hypothetical protein [Prosthecobacter sp.]